MQSDGRRGPRGPRFRTKPRGGRASLVLVLGLLPLLPGPCGDDSPGGRQRLSGSAGSLDELATDVLAGLASADTFRLEALRLTESEHNERVYPELPAARPENNHPAEMAWANIQLRNRVALGRLLAVFAGHQLAMEGVECRGPTMPFETFVVHTDCWVMVSRDGEPARPFQLFKDVLDRNGRLKIFRYYEP